MNFELNKLPTTEGIALAAKMLHNGYLSSVVGKHQTVLSNGIRHIKYNGKPYWFTEDDRQRFQQAIRKIGSELIMAQLVAEPTTPDTDPCCAGTDWVEKFKTLSTRIQLKYLFEVRLGKNRDWYRNRITSKTNVYNKFKPEEIQQINSALHQMALDLCAIELVADERSVTL